MLKLENEKSAPVNFCYLQCYLELLEIKLWPHKYISIRALDLLENDIYVPSSIKLAE